MSALEKIDPTGRRIAQRLSDEFLACRQRHDWQPSTAEHLQRRVWYVVEVCSRCGTKCHRELTESGHLLARWYHYPPGYLLPKGQGLTRSARDALRLETIKRTFAITERKSGEPHSLAARTHILGGSA
jgi:hypothetical protein